MPLSLSQMYRVTPGNIRKNSKAAVVKVRKRGQYKKYARLGDTYEIVYKVKCTKEWRNVTLRFLKGKNNEQPKASLAQPVWVRCTCPWFLYNCEYALTKNGSSWVHYSNGEPANQTNPKNIPFVCKHVYALQNEIRNFKMQEAPFREPKRKVLPGPVLKRDEVLPTEESPTLTRQQQRVKDTALEQAERAVEQIEDVQAPKSIVDRVKNKLLEIVDRIDDSKEPVADATAKELKRLVTDIKDEGVKALTNTRIVNKLNDLIKKFRGY